METLIGALRAAFAGEHPGGVLAFALEREDPGGVREFAGDVLFQVPFQDIAPGLVAGQGDLRDLQVREGLRMGLYLYFLVPDVESEKFLLIGFQPLVPVLEHLPVLLVQVLLRFFVGGFQAPEHGGVCGSAAERFYGFADGIQPLGYGGLLFRPLIVIFDRFRYLGEIPDPGGGDDEDPLVVGAGPGALALERHAGLFDYFLHEFAVELVYALVVELGGDGSENGQVLRLGVPGAAAAGVLLPHVAQSVQGPFLLELVDGHQVGVIQHVYLFQLGGGPVFRGHHIDGDVAVVHDLGVGLADAGAFKDYRVEAGRFADADSVLYIFG